MIKGLPVGGFVASRAKKSKSKDKKTPPRNARRSRDLPASYGALEKVRKELKGDIASVRYEMKAGFKRIDARFNKMEARFSDIDARFNKMEARFADIDARFNKMEARFAGIDARFDKLEAQIATINSTLEKINATQMRMLALIEEQNARNKASFEGAESVRVQQDALTKRVEALEHFQHDVSTRLKTN